jgi:hypothetical protein
VDDSDPRERALWKIPITHNLSDPVADSEGNIIVLGVSRKLLDDIDELHNYGCNHFGDLSYYLGYLIIAVEGGAKPVMAIFRSDDLTYKGMYPVDQSGAGWAAVDPYGYVYSSSSSTSSILKYYLDWTTVEGGSWEMEPRANFPLRDENGAGLYLRSMQGGVFTDSGELFYCTSGSGSEHYPHDGINVFNTQTWIRVQRSTNDFGYFRYEFDPGLDDLQEPEGLTIWDLDDDPRVHDIVSGQLHVLMLDNTLIGTDEVYIKHYTGTIYVNGQTGNDANWGRPHESKKTVGSANNLINTAVPPWHGARIEIQAGTYPETLTFSTRMQVLGSGGGPVIIGQP